MCTLNGGSALPNNLYVFSNNRLCYDMFFDERLRGLQPMESSSAPQEVIIESLAEDLYNPTIQHDDIWKQFALPTPPYSPENYLPQANCKGNFIISSHKRNGLQVVPEPEDLSSDLPLVFSDAEMERLKSTIEDDYIWPSGESDFDRVESQRFQDNRVVLSAACVNEPSAEMAAEHRMLREFSPFVPTVTNQDPALARQQIGRWHSQFSGEYDSYFIQIEKLLTLYPRSQSFLTISQTTQFHFRIARQQPSQGLDFVDYSGSLNLVWFSSIIINNGGNLVCFCHLWTGKFLFLS